MNQKPLVLFTDQKRAFEQRLFYGHTQQQIIQSNYFNDIFITYDLKFCIVLDQVHSAQGMVVSDSAQAYAYTPYSFAGDFIITHLPKVALMVATADCLPFVIYDRVQSVIAVVHAGWRGVLSGIVDNVIELLVSRYNVSVDNISITCGPSAGVCCYQVGQEWVLEFENDSIFRSCVIKKNNTWYFDNVQYVSQQLLNKGVMLDNISLKSWMCTIENPSFCSYRRDGAFALRQMTIVALL